VLWLREHDGEEHSYEADVSSECLMLKQPWKDRQLVATFDRQH
jgi:hypothetical protein